MVEAGGVANSTLGIPSATGDLNAIDSDNPIDVWNPVNSPTPSTNGYGSFILTPDGVWTYTLDDSNPAVQALNDGQTLTDDFLVTTIGGTPQLVTITIHGTNDAATISGTTGGSVTEAGGFANGMAGIPAATGDLNAADVDDPPADALDMSGRLRDH